MVRTRSEATFDTAPNQFVRHALEAWRGLAVDLMAGLESSTSLGAGPRGRGRREARWLRDRCDELLALPAMRAAGPFRGFGRSDQVLLRRPGYREVLRAFALADASLGLDLEVPHDVFSATRRNVATLYEYWCYLAIVDVIGRVAGAPPPGAAFRPSGDGLSLALEQGTGSKVAWTCEVDGRRLALELWFNRTFVPGEERSDATSWARRLRPDISLRVRPTRARPGQGRSGSPLDPALDVWLHFDAKYRIRALVVDDEVVGADDDEVPPAVHSGEAKREDLLKMHAYRDAIRRSAGAYVLYPGSGPGAVQQELHEILPGIGAFPLRPASGGRADGTEALARFIEDVLAHVADQSTARERAQYWSWEHQEPRESRVVPVEGAPRPPADLTVLVGYVREEQDDWVHGHALYNVRAGDRRGAIPLDSELLDADLVLLWTWGSDRRAGLRSIWRRTGPWTVVDGADLASLGYPAKELDHRYLVTGLSPLQQGSSWTVDRDRLVAASSSDGSPVLVRWIDLAARSV